MSKRRDYITILGTISFLLSGCIEPYQPPLILDDIDILVVDGFLDVTAGAATVRLTYANALADENKIKPELNATVAVHTDGGNSYTLIEQDTGTYFLDGLSINPTAKYQLSVHTKNEENYISDYVEVTTSPPIDSITWEAKNDGVNILVNAHDPLNNTMYYRWDYIETWKYHAAVSSDFKLVNKVPEYRSAADRIHECWKTLPSTRISIATTARLADDVIHNYPIVFLPKGTNKVSVKYSILVKQRASSKQEFDFLEQLQKSTESVGGLFDAMPSQVIGNIHNLSNPSTPALGFFSAGTINEQRFFLDFYDLPDHLNKLPRMMGCQVDTVCVVPGALQCTVNLQDLAGTELLGTAIYSGPSLIGYTKTIPRCADCRVQGGSLTKPAFWP